MASPEQLAEYRKKAYLSPKIGKHGKRKKTIEKEKREAIFEEFVSQEFLKLIKLARPEYKLDRFLGKMPETLDLNAKIERITNPEDRKELEKILQDAIGRYYDR